MIAIEIFSQLTVIFIHAGMKVLSSHLMMTSSSPIIIDESSSSERLEEHTGRTGSSTIPLSRTALHSGSTTSMVDFENLATWTKCGLTMTDNDESTKLHELVSSMIDNDDEDDDYFDFSPSIPKHHDIVLVTLVILATLVISQHCSPTSPSSPNPPPRRSFVLLINIKLFFASVIVKPWICVCLPPFSKNQRANSWIDKFRDEILFSVGVCNGYSFSSSFSIPFLVMTFPSLLSLFPSLFSNESLSYSSDNSSDVSSL